MQALNFVTKDELLNQLESQIKETGIWWDESDVDENGIVDISNLESEFKHLTVSSKQIDFMKIHGIDLDDFCRDHEIDFVSQAYDGEIEFIHATRVSNFEDIKQMGLIVNPDATYIPDLGEGIYGVDANSEKGIDNLKTFLMDFNDDEILLVKGIYNGKYNYCIKGENHEGYILFYDKVISPINLSYKIMQLNDFFFEY